MEMALQKNCSVPCALNLRLRVLKDLRSQWEAILDAPTPSIKKWVAPPFVELQVHAGYLNSIIKELGLNPSGKSRRNKNMAFVLLYQTV